MKIIRWICVWLSAVMLVSMAAQAEMMPAADELRGEEIGMTQEETATHTAAMAGSNSFRLPGNTRAIEARAFEGDAALTVAVLPEGLESIGTRAFAGTGLTLVSMPASVKSIADDAFEGCPEALVVHGVKDSPAQTWCAKHASPSSTTATATPGQTGRPTTR